MPTLTVQPSGKDNFLQLNAPTSNNGAAAVINLSSQLNSDYRILLYFDISNLPAGAIITSAIASLYYYDKITDPVGEIVWAYKLTRDDWEELTSSWNNYKTGSPWTNPGGDYVTSNPVGGDTVYPAGYGWINFDIKAIVEDAIANVSKHVNILVKFETEAGGNGNKYAWHYSNNEITQTTLRPKLVIEYTLPPSPNLTDKNNYNGYLAFIQQYIRHKINGTDPWKNPDGTLL